MTTLDRYFWVKIPRARNPRGTRDPGKRTVFLLPVPSGASAKTADLECTHLIVSKSAVFTTTRAHGDLAAGCMGLDRVDLIWGKS